MSSYLFAAQSALSGAARTLDVGGLFDFYNISRTGQIADRRGLTADWKAVSSYLKGSIEELKSEIGTTPQEAR